MSVDVPQLELYTYVSKDLEAWIERSKGIFQEAEAEAEKITPELFREFVAVGEDGQAELLHQLKLIKANTHGNAKSEWYDWKLQWVEQLLGKAEKGFIDLTEVRSLSSVFSAFGFWKLILRSVQDAKALEVVTKQAQALVPSLREEYEQVMGELKQEKALVAEIENSDQKYLSELKNTISEQKSVFSLSFFLSLSLSLRNLNLTNTCLMLVPNSRLSVRTLRKATRSSNVWKRSCRSLIYKSGKPPVLSTKLSGSFTSRRIVRALRSLDSKVGFQLLLNDVIDVMFFPLTDELETLENLHLWRTVKVHPDWLEFIYASMYRVSIPCVKFKPVVHELDIRRLDHVTTKFKDVFPQLSDLMLRMAKQVIIRDGDNTSIREVNYLSKRLV
jgi:hypothetical protein